MANYPAIPSSSREGSLTYLDFFAGAGLVRLGLEPAWSCKWANDIDPRKQEIYLANFGDDEFVLDDVGKVTATPFPPEPTWHGHRSHARIFRLPDGDEELLPSEAEPSGNSGG